MTHTCGCWSTPVSFFLIDQACNFSMLVVLSSRLDLKTAHCQEKRQGGKRNKGVNNAVTYTDSQSINRPCVCLIKYWSPEAPN